MKGENPTFKGFLTSEEKDPKARKNIGNVALWENKSENPKAPLYTGTIQTEKGRKYRIVLWKFLPKEGGL